MRIKIVEDLETDLQVRQEKNDALLAELEEIFKIENFKIKNEINGTSFNKKEGNISASFYVDNDVSYKGYVTNDAENSSNYSVKGNSENVLKAAQQVIDTFYQGLESEDENV